MAPSPEVGDMALLEFACERGMITGAQLQEIRRECATNRDRGVRRSPTRVAIERGMLNEQDFQELGTERWIKSLPSELGDYRLTKMLGRGGIAVVYQAEDLSLGKQVAVKILMPDFTSSEAYLARFLREARIAARLTHPNTVQVFRAGEQDGVHYLVMEYVEGETLSSLLRRRGPMPEREALLIAAQVAGALAEAAGLGIVHRDVKPANILLSRWGAPKLADFGIAKEVSDVPNATLHLSLTMGVVGTPTYMSPEQARGVRRLDFRSDMYSLGATLYHMVVGNLPFDTATPQEMMVRVVSEAPKPPLLARAGLSEGAGAVICRMMAKGPANRYESLEELIADLEAAAEGSPVSTDYGEAVELLRPARRPEFEEGRSESNLDLRRIAIIAFVVTVAVLLALVALQALMK